MSQKESLRQQAVKLHEVKQWIGDRLYEEADRSTRDALLGASLAVGLAILNFEKIRYLTATDQITDRMYNTEDR